MAEVTDTHSCHRCGNPIEAGTGIVIRTDLHPYHPDCPLKKPTTKAKAA